MSSNINTGVIYNGSNGIGSYTIANSNASLDSSLIVSQGKMTVTVPLEVNGIDIEQVLQDLMAVTGVVPRNRKLEDKYAGLKKAGDIYQETLRNVQIDVNIKIKKAADNYRLAEEKYKTLEIIKESA
jgi:hypothetical protein